VRHDIRNKVRSAFLPLVRSEIDPSPSERSGANSPLRSRVRGVKRLAFAFGRASDAGDAGSARFSLPACDIRPSSWTRGRELHATLSTASRSRSRSAAPRRSARTRHDAVCRGVRYVHRWFDIRYTFTIAQAIDRPACADIAVSRAERILRCRGLCTRLGTHPRE